MKSLDFAAVAHDCICEDGADYIAVEQRLRRVWNAALDSAWHDIAANTPALDYLDARGTLERIRLLKVPDVTR